MSEDELKKIQKSEDAERQRGRETFIRDERNRVIGSKGKPPRLTPVIYKTIVTALEESAMSNAQLAALVGVSKYTFRDWLVQGEKWLETNKLPKEKELNDWLLKGKPLILIKRYAFLSRKLAELRAKLIQRLSNSLISSACGNGETPPDGNLLFKILERLDKDQYGQRNEQATGDQPEMLVVKPVGKIILPAEVPLEE